jgi:hypothetical protein
MLRIHIIIIKLINYKTIKAKYSRELFKLKVKLRK